MERDCHKADMPLHSVRTSHGWTGHGTGGCPNACSVRLVCSYGVWSLSLSPCAVLHASEGTELLWDFCNFWIQQ